MAPANTKAGHSRPTSPHLGIYRMRMNMAMSIVHRITGIALYAGTLLLAWWLIAAAIGPGYFKFVNGLLASLPGQIVLAGYTWALLHHMLGGLRHFVWDTGRGFNLGTVDAMSWGTLIGSLGLTVLVWALVIGRSGGL